MRALKDHFLIGDLHTAALIHQGSIDWLCLPDFDSPSIFARLLDEDGGCFSVEDATCTGATYEDDTAIVTTSFTDDNSTFTVKDFMVPHETNDCDTHLLVRTFTGEHGESRIRLRYQPRPDYGCTTADLRIDGTTVTFEYNNGMVSLHLPGHATLERSDDSVEIELRLAEDEEARVLLEYRENGSCIGENTGYEDNVRRFWHDWVDRGDYFDFCRDNLVRSAITLKLMQYHPTGALIAAPTTSLPETLGGERNWDYRYVWIRDATFTLYAFYILGYEDEAQRFFDYIEGVAKKCEQCSVELDLMYDIHGNPVPDEQILEHLEGYEQSRPVRIGNGAADQFQLDVYGALIDAYYFMHEHGACLAPEKQDIIDNLVDHIQEKWNTPDSGIWEVRGGDKHYTYSKVVSWVGVDRALRLSDDLDITEQERRERQELREEIEDWIWKHCYHDGKLVQHPGTEHQDATNFLFVLLRFLDKDEDRTARILETTSDELTHEDIYVYRYLLDDNLDGEEGAFNLCTSWLISALARTGDLDRAYNIFRQFEQHIADNGLLSEEIDPDTGRYLGNHPQAFSHMGYIMSAYFLNRYSDRAENL